MSTVHRRHLQRRGPGALAALLAVGFLLACMGLDDAAHMDPVVASALDAIEPTRVEDPALGGAPLAELQGGGAPPMDSGAGVQVVQVAPLGAVRRALQVAVVFDRPMVPLTQLDDMIASVPLSCEADGVSVPMKGRWAGTTTAVVLPDNPDKAFPNATAFTCVVPAGVTAVDGTPLENEIRWSFETPRPRVTGTTPRKGETAFSPDAELVVRFDQPVDVGSVGGRVSLIGGDGAFVPTQVVPDADDPKVVRLSPTGMKPDTAYTLQVDAGVVGRSGPLPSTAAHAVTFRTYPPLRLDRFEPIGVVNPVAGLSLRFSTRVDPEQVAERLTLDPAPAADRWSPPGGNWSSTSWRYTLALEPRTVYTVTLAPGVTDIHGQTIDKAHTWTFETEDYTPWLNVSTGFALYAANNPPQLPYRSLNAHQMQVEVFTIPPDWVGGLKSLNDFDTLRGVQTTTLDLSQAPTPNQVTLGSFDLTPYLKNGRGLVAYRMQSPQLARDGEPYKYDGTILVTDLGATLKVSPGGIEAWVTRLSDGRPAANAEVTFYRGTERLGEATTDARGLARFEGAPTVGWGPWDWDKRLRAVIHLGEDVSLVEHNWNDGISPWIFGIWSRFDVDGRDATGHAFTDRGVYRPGDTAYARATFRVKSAQGLEVPVGQEVTWSFTDPDGSTLQEGEGTLDARGGVNLEAVLPEDGKLGTYSFQIRASGPGWVVHEYVPVPARAYRPPAFRVSVDGPSEGVAGETLTATVDARYLFGAPLSSGEVAWRMWSERRWFRPDGWEGFRFGPSYGWWEDEDGSRNQIHGSERAELAEGRHTLSKALEIGSLHRPTALFLEAEVIDTDRQAVANRTEVLVHPAAWYLGLRLEQRMPKVGERAAVQVVGVRPDGTVQAGERAEVKVIRRTWNRVREKGVDGHWNWVYSQEDTEVASEQIRLGAQPVPVAFTPDEAGFYVVVAESADARGNKVRASTTLYATGRGYVSWALSDGNDMELIPDKEVYQPGDVARILVKSPRPDLSALVSLEREGVLWRDVVTLEGTASVVEIPITEAHRPNVFASVVAVTGAPPQDSPDKGRPEVRVGMVELKVDTEGARLDVAVRPEREVYRPGDAVTVTVDVKRDGRPAAGAGVTLYAVDEAVLSLTAYKTPEAHGSFYGARALSTLTADSRVRVMNRAPYLTKGASRGGGGGDEGDGPEMRSRFLTTVAWEPDLKTGPDGTLRHTFELPDNLTTFRIMAVVDEAADAFGSGEQEIRVTRPVIARPALPRFLRNGDVAYAGVVVHNNTDAERAVDVTATATGPVQLTGSPVWVSIPAHGAVEVPFRLKTDEMGEGEATFEFTATSGSERDAVRWTLPVRRDLTWETVATTGSTTDQAVERIARPDAALRDVGSLDVDVASTVLVGAGSGLDYLVEYPHGCVEQITSRAVAGIQALRIREAAGIQMSEADLRAMVEGVLRELDEYQLPSGALGYWRGSTWPSVMGTAYAVELMGRAREAGIEVDEAVLDRRAQFLRSVLSGRHTQGWDPLVSLAARSYVQVALARAGRGDAGHNNNLYTQRENLSVLGLASLLEAIARTTGPDERVDTLERLILSRSYVEAATASVKENQGRRWASLWASDDLSTAAALEALVVAKGTHPMAERYARHLTSARRQGRWHNTRATAGVLAALARYAEAYEAAGEPIEAQIRLANTSLLQSTLEGPDSAHLSLPMAEVENGDLEVASDGGRLYYDVRLRYVPTEVKARDEGFTLRRSYEILEGGGGAGQVTSGALMQVTLQVITPVGRHAVAIVDPLPAGLEPVDSSFATSSQAPRPDGPGHDDEELPKFTSSRAFDHHELRDDQVRLYASYMPPGIHTWRYVVRATTPGTFDHLAATVEEMYEPENFGRTRAGQFTVGRARR